MSEIYKGPSDGFETVVDGYQDYAMEVIARRAVPDVRDGLKPVNRRIIYTAYKNKKGFLQKCATIVSDAMKLHPHGDQAIYSAFSLLTDSNGSCNIPMFKGMGNLGHVYSSDKPAAMRYPKAMVHSNMEYYFNDKDIIKLVPSEEGDGEEPAVLPAQFPIVLVNGSMGIAVSVGTKMPSFNMVDVLELTQKYVKNKKLDVTDMIIPDFPTGGVLVCNNEEIAKIMLTGKGKLKIRARVEIDGKNIYVQEVPYGKTVEGIVKSINNSDIKDISKAFLSTGRGSKGMVTITCKSKKVTETVLLTLYRKNILQSTFGSSILVIEDGEPKILGVYGVVDTWYKWRVKELTRKFNQLLEGIKSELVTLDYFIRLINNQTWRDTYVDTYLHKGKSESDAYLHQIFEDIPQETCDWILGRALSTFNNGGKYLNRFNDLKESQEYYLESLSHVDNYIVEELEGIKKKAKREYPRKTEISYTDYRFSKISDTEEIEDTSYCIYTMYKDGFLSKTRNKELASDIMYQIEAHANSVLIGFDNFGRVLRVIGKEIPFTAPGERGVYLPKYFEATFEEKYKVLYLGLLDGKKRMLVYRDGYVGFFDTNEFYGKKNIKIVSKGVCTAVMDKLLEIYEENEIPDYLLLADDTKGDLRIAVLVTQTVPERSRLSRAKVVNGTDIDTKYIKGFNNLELIQFMSQSDDYVGKLKKYKGYFYDTDAEIPDGKLLEFNLNLEV